MLSELLSLPIAIETDAVAARRGAREIAVALGFSKLDQTRIATAVSEIVRNALEYAGGGRARFALDTGVHPFELVIVVRDDGPGIAELEAVLDGTYRSKTGMGRGIAGSRQLMDRYEIESAAGQGTRVTMTRFLTGEPDAGALQRLTASARATGLAEPAAQPAEELHEQNRELVATLGELGNRQEELVHLAHELEATNRGVVALYAELDERADALRRADLMKTRFLSNMSHELRTPLSSIRALSMLLLNRIDGELTTEQDKQVTLIRKAADELMEIVNDLLDLAKIEAGRVDVLPVRFGIVGLFEALRTMLAPLQTNADVQLVFETPALPEMISDEAKLTQILRNFISNALKFTERGEIRVGARLDERGDALTFFVADTGIGIAPDHLELVFEEFGQVQNRLQHRVKGTGLGLPLCRKLGALLGGEVGVTSELGAGSTFYVALPLDAARHATLRTSPDSAREGAQEAVRDGVLHAAPAQPRGESR